MLKRQLGAGTIILACAVVLCAAGGAAAQTYHDNVVIILDASGSMDDKMGGMPIKKMDAAKNALKEVIQRIPNSTHVGLLVFSQHHRGNPWLYPLSPLDANALSRAIGSVRADGGTPLGAFIKQGADRLLKEREAQFGYGSYRLLVVTDGEANDQDLVDQYTPAIIARGMVVDAIGVDMQQDHTLATLAHSYRRADDADSLAQAVAEVFAEVSTSDGDAASGAEFELLDGIPPEVAAAMLGALAKTNNAPIDGNADRVEGKPARRQRASSSGTPVSRNSSRGSSKFKWLILLAIVVGFIKMVTRKT